MLYQTADAGDTLSDSGCRSLSIRQRMQEYAADADVSLLDNECRRRLSDSGCRSLSIRQRMLEKLYQTADAGAYALYQTADAGDIRRSLSIRQLIQERLYQTGDTEVSLLDS